MRIAKFETVEGTEVMIDLESIVLILYGSEGATVSIKSGRGIALELDQAKLLEHAWVLHLDRPKAPKAPLDPY